MSSRQCFGGGGSSSGAINIFSSTPQTSQRYRTLMRRISPVGGGAGNDRVTDRSIPIPDFQTTNASRTPNATHRTVEAAGTPPGYGPVATSRPI